jgi:hypothetical protein
VHFVVGHCSITAIRLGHHGGARGRRFGGAHVRSLHNDATTTGSSLDSNGVLDGSHCDRFGALEKRKDCCSDVGLRVKRIMEKRRSSGGCGWMY